MLLLILSLGSLVAGEASNSTAHSTGGTISDAGAKVTELATSLLLLTFKVLLATLLLEGLW